MTEKIYEKLAKHLDNLPGGFPPTKSGVELRILRRLFTPEEAKLALKLTVLPEEADAIAPRADLSPEETARRLEGMARKGLIYRIESEGQPPRYMAIQYVIGIWEFHVNDLDAGLIRDMDEYMPTLLNFETWKKAPQLRTIPVEQSIPVQLEVMPYEKAEELVKAQTKIAVAPCICRRERNMVGEGCDKPLETCLILGRGADYYIRNGLGRLIDQKEALEILREADRAGLVLQPGNSQQAVNICCCCGCCCGVLRTIKRHPRPASIVSSAFVAAADASTCEGCGTCLERCQMEALELVDNKVVHNIDRCIGCGLCVSTCPSGSLVLVRRPESEQPDVPRSWREALLRLARVRGKL
jgi:ferredoxin